MGNNSNQTPSVSSDIAVAASFSDALVAAGGSTQLVVKVVNLGPGTARNIELGAEWGAGLEVGDDADCVASGGAVCPTDAEDSIRELPPNGALTFTLPVTLANMARGEIRSTLLVAAETDTVLANNVAAPMLRGYMADLAVAGTGPAAPVLAGTGTSYTMTVTNLGPDTARDVRLLNTIGPSQAVGAMTCVASAGATCPAVLSGEMTVPVLPVNGRLTLSVPASVAAGSSGSLGNTLRATAAGDHVAGNNVVSASASAYVTLQRGLTGVQLQSDPTDFVGQGESHQYSLANAAMTFTAVGGQLRVQVTGDKSWSGEFHMPNGAQQFQVGSYANLPRAMGIPNLGGLSWGGDGRGCNTSVGAFTVNSVTYAGGVLEGIDLTFEQHCEGAAAALRGQVTWVASDTTRPAGPPTPPATLWAPAAQSVPATGSYVHLQSDVGDFVGRGLTSNYTRSNAVLNVTASGNRIHVSVGGDQSWTGDFAMPDAQAQAVPGYYGDLIRYPFHNPTKGGLSWSGEGRGCNTLSGWFVVDNVTWTNGSLSTLDLRFEQHCEGSAPALRGKIHWESSDTAAPAGPVNPIPAGLWTPAPAALPASGNYVYLASQPGDYIGQGLISTLRAADAPIAAFTGTGRVSIVSGGWTGDFQAMNTLGQLQPGYYPNLQRYPFHNVVRGGLNWSGNGRGCNTLQGWFAVDSVSYDATGLAAIDLRFEQFCDGNLAPLRGKVHWVR